MNTTQGMQPGQLQTLLEALAYNAGAGWQQWVTWGLPVVAMIFLFTEVLAKSEARRKSNLVCLIQVFLGLVVMLAALVFVNGVFLKTASSITALIGSLVALVVVAAGLLAPLGMLISGVSYGAPLKAWLVTVTVSVVLVLGSNFGWQKMKKGGFKVIAIEGTVEHRASPLQGWSGLTETNSVLPVGTFFKTSTGGSAKLQLGPAIVVSVRPESVLAVKLSKGLPVVSLESGKLAGDVVPGQNEKFLIRSPAATSGILGTRFMVQSDAEKTTRTIVAEGAVAVEGAVANSSQVTVREGMATVVKLGSPPEEPAPAVPSELAEVNLVFPKRAGFIR